MGGGPGAGAAVTATAAPSSDPNFPAQRASQAGSYFLRQTLKGALETLAEQRVKQRVDVRVQQHQPVREGHGGVGHESGSARDRGLCGLDQSHGHVRCPAEEKGCDDQEEAH